MSCPPKERLDRDPVSQAEGGKLAAGSKASPVALVVASAAVWSFEISVSPEGSTTVSIARVSYDSSLAGIGAGIGSLLRASGRASA